MNRDYGAPLDFMESEPVGRALDCLGSRQASVLASSTAATPHQPGPFHYLINEQAKSLLALQELQHEVGALLEFRDLVIETFPSLRTKLSSGASVSSSVSTVGAQVGAINGGGHHHHQTGTAGTTNWAPGVRVRRKITSNKKSEAVQDSGFSTETSSKDTHSASSTAMAATSAGPADETDDELSILLDLIHRKGTRLRDEVEALQGHLQQSSVEDDVDDDDVHDNNFQGALFKTSEAEARQIRRERDSLMGRLAEMEAEVVAGRIHTSRLQEDLEQLQAAKQELEEQLRSVLNQRGEVNSRIHDMHSQFVAAKNVVASAHAHDDNRTSRNVIKVNTNVKVVSGDSSSSSVTANRACAQLEASNRNRNRSRTSSSNVEEGSVNDASSSLDRVLGERVPKVDEVDRTKFAAILSECDPSVLQRHLLSSTVRNEILTRQLESASRLEVNLVDKLDKVREENEELKFQLEDQSIELEGTRARVRMLEQSQQQQRSPPSNFSGPDVIPTSTLSSSPPSRGEILSSSMKNMSPIAMAQPQTIDHTSSTESAHDQTESNRKSSTDSARRRPSKIPLKSYTAPKPPGRGNKTPPTPASINNNNGNASRGRNGSDSPCRSHGSNTSTPHPHNNHHHHHHNSHNNHHNRDSSASLKSLKSLKSGSGSLPKSSRNGSLVAAKDSLSSKLRSSDSMSRLNNAASSSSSFSCPSPSGGGTTNPRNINNGTLRKNSTPNVRWSSGAGNREKEGQQQQQGDKDSAESDREKSRYRWNRSSSDRRSGDGNVSDYLDSLDHRNDEVSSFSSSIDESSSRRFQTANNFTWRAVAVTTDPTGNNFYDSIDLNAADSSFNCRRKIGEAMAECDDSLEIGRFSEE